MIALRQIQAVTFDVGGTLIRPWPSVGHVYADVAAQHGLNNLSPETLNKNFAEAWRAKKNFQHTKEGWAEIVDRTFAGLCEPPPSRTIFPAIYRRFSEATAWRIYEDALPTLQALASQDITLAVISNWDDRLRPLLRQLRIDRYFEAIIVSCEVGFAKPSPVIFEQAAKLLRLQPEQILHVGDGATEDLAGAASAGLQALLINRDQAVVEAPQISSLRQVEIILFPH